MGSSSQQFSLKWNNYLKHITGAFEIFRTDEDLVDVTLSCGGKKIRAHKMLLSACSSYFKELFKENPCQHPVIIFRDVKFSDLEAMITFIYQGEVNVTQDNLPSFLNVAELLCIQGLTTNSQSDEQSCLQNRLQNGSKDECLSNRTSHSQPGVTRVLSTTAAIGSRNESMIDTNSPSASPVRKRRKCNNSEISNRRIKDYSNERLLVESNHESEQDLPIKIEQLNYQVRSPSSDSSCQLIEDVIGSNFDTVIKEEKADSMDDCYSDELSNSNLYSDISMQNIAQFEEAKRLGNLGTVTSVRNKELIVEDNFTFYKSTTLRNGEVKWRCTKKTCNTNLFTVGEQEERTTLRIVGTHNHPPYSDLQLHLKQLF